VRSSRVLSPLPVLISWPLFVTLSRDNCSPKVAILFSASAPYDSQSPTRKGRFRGWFHRGVSQVYVNFERDFCRNVRSARSYSFHAHLLRCLSLTHSEYIVEMLIFSFRNAVVHLRIARALV
jgi:hypothetical protein